MPDNEKQLRGKFIVLEGLDGADVSTHARNLAQWLTDVKNVPQVHLTREPSDGPIGSYIRMHLRGRLEIDKLTLAAFFAADRLDHLFCSGTGIIARLESGDFVVCDRYYLASYSYQGSEPGITFDWIEDLNAHCRRPDLTIFIDAPVDHCIQKILSYPARELHLSVLDASPENIPSMTAQLNRVREAYLEAIDLLRDKGERIATVAKHTPVQIERAVRGEVAAVLKG